MITAREEAQKEQDIVQRRNDQLKTQLADMESLLEWNQQQRKKAEEVSTEASMTTRSPIRRSLRYVFSRPNTEHSKRKTIELGVVVPPASAAVSLPIILQEHEHIQRPADVDGLAHSERSADIDQHPDVEGSEDLDMSSKATLGRRKSLDSPESVSTTDKNNQKEKRLSFSENASQTRR